MSMSTHIQGFREPDETWRKMKAVWDSCDKAGISPPKEVDKFFDYETPDEAGIAIDLKNHECCSKAGGDMEDGFEIDISKLPDNITKIRFINAY